MSTCKACRFAFFPTQWEGECRRRSPIAVHDPNKYLGVYPQAFVARWPSVSAEDACGDFEPVKAQP